MMTKTQINNLKKYLQEYSREISIENNPKLKSAISIVIDQLENYTQNMPTKKIDDIDDIIDLIEGNEIDKLIKKYPKLKYSDLILIIDSEQNSNTSFSSYTIMQLKVIYFLLTKDKANNAIKTRKKSIVLDAVQEALLDRKRNMRLKNS